MSRTLSFETEHSGRRLNIMVSDPGDPALRIGEIGGLNQRVLTPVLIDVLSVNENALMHLAKGVAEDASEIESAEELLFGAASVFRMMIPRVDFHTPEFSATFVD